MKLCITGSVFIENEVFVYSLIDAFIREQCIGKPTIITGGKLGVDTIAKSYAADRAIDCVEFLPYYLMDKSSLFYKRHLSVKNRQMIDNSQKAFVIHDGKDADTEQLIAYSKRAGVPVMIVNTEK